MKISGRLSGYKPLFLLFLAVFAGMNVRAGDCGCTEKRSFEDAFETANLIFVGEVSGEQTNPNKSGWLITFRQDSSWKRPVEKYPQIFTEYVTACGYPFKRGVKYLIFVEKGHNSLFTTICEPNAPLYQAAGMIEKLGPGIAPDRTPGTGKLPFILTGMVLAGMIFLAFVVLRKRGRK